MRDEEIVRLLNAFMQKARADPRIAPAHISLYTALLCHAYDKKREGPIFVFSHQVMPLCKLAGSATYHRSIKQLDDYGYIKYVPSNNHFLGSVVYFITPQNISSVNNK